MSNEVEFLRDQVQRLNSALSHYQDGHRSQATLAPQGEEARHAETPAPWLSDRSIMVPLLSEYDRHMDDMTEQLQRYQMQMTEVKLKLDRVVKENERLHAELRESVERQLQTLPGSTGPGVEGDTLGDEGLINNLQEQIQLSVQDQLIQFQQHIQKLQVTNQKLESTNQQFLKTLTEQSTEMEELRIQLRQAKADLRMATAKVEEMTKLLQNVQDQIQRREDDAAEAHGREEASDRRLHHLQSALSQLEARLTAASQEAESVRREQVVWERQVGELQVRCASLEDDRYEAFSKVRDSIQLAEEASLQKDQALLREKQKSEELDKMNEAIRQLIQDAAIRTRKEEERSCFLLTMFSLDAVFSEEERSCFLLTMFSLDAVFSEEERSCFLLTMFSLDAVFSEEERSCFLLTMFSLDAVFSEEERSCFLLTMFSLDAVENVRKQCNSQIHRMAEELSALTTGVCR
ncbi:unnamed protein product [Coregonus sp. 'balchen']|nr:unnamed protein product [Coregonus sp. 'balchen']